MAFRFRDRWQSSIREAWDEDRKGRTFESFSRLLALLENHDAELENYLDTQATTDWATPTLLNSWLNVSPATAPARYRKVGDEVKVLGLVRNGTSGAPVFNLPVGFRPALSLMFPILVDPNVIGRLDIESDGDVIVSVLAGTNAFASINISFPIT